VSQEVIKGLIKDKFSDELLFVAICQGKAKDRVQLVVVMLVKFALNVLIKRLESFEGLACFQFDLDTVFIYPFDATFSLSVVCNCVIYRKHASAFQGA
jgi:hypothetical protein